ncbi:hypothetical protein A2U01_0077882, partial [Trifolium medium]|nr:hypothetical protein [Trifolium medium]
MLDPSTTNTKKEQPPPCCATEKDDAESHRRLSSHHCSVRLHRDGGFWKSVGEERCGFRVEEKRRRCGEVLEEAGSYGGFVM